MQFTEEEKVEYSKMEGAARQFYLNLKASMKKKSGRIGKHYLALMQKLTPLRIACAGGKLPLDDGVKIPEEERGGDDDDDDDSEGDSDSDDDEHEEKRNKKIQKYSKFAFTSKLAALIRELESIREKDKTGKFILVHLGSFLSALPHSRVALYRSQPNASCFPSSTRHLIGLRKSSHSMVFPTAPYRGR